MLAACGGADTSHMQSDWELKNAGRLAKEKSDQAIVALPRFPRAERLLPFTVGTANFSFLIDRDSVRVDDDRIVRYAMVARSPNGVENVSFEGINCQAGEYAVYAVGREDGSWVRRPHAWRPIERRTMHGAHQALQRDYFCPRGIAIASAAEGVKALETGGHPLTQGPVPPSGPR